MIDAVEANLGRRPEQASADSGYCSEANLEALESRHIDGYVATGRAKDAVAGAAKDQVAAEATNANATTNSPRPIKAPTRVEAMRERIKAGGHSSPYRLRKQLPEPVFGQIKHARGFRQFLMRGLEKVARSSARPTTCRSSLRGGVCLLQRRWPCKQVRRPPEAARRYPDTKPGRNPLA
jgi:Transposase DDE domain